MLGRLSEAGARQGGEFDDASTRRDAVYGIGAAARMVGIPAATLRTWEERYEIISPARTDTGRRLYSRDQVEQLRFVASEIARGLSAADAHRLLEGRSGVGGRAPAAVGASAPRVLVLIAARDQYSAELLDFFLRTEGFSVESAFDAEEAKRMFERMQPNLSLIEFLLAGGAGEELCRWLAEHGTAPILVLSSLNVADRALSAGADAFLLKPVSHLQLVSAVKDLLGVSALVTRPKRPS